MPKSGVCALAVLLVLPACWGTDGKPRTSDSPQASSETTSTTNAPSASAWPCNQPPQEPPEPGSAANTTTILVYFECKYDPPETVRAVQRRVPRSSAVLRAALEQLVDGPAEEEGRRGFSSFFSDAPPGLLVDVALRRNGTAVIDFSQEIKGISNITTLNGMASTHRSIDATVFQFPQVEAVALRINGSEDAWCDLFGIVCRIRTRSEWERARAEQVAG